MSILLGDGNDDDDDAIGNDENTTSLDVIELIFLLI
jgi:hypothetical protein